jgi:ubiquinone/menaquinone biosynthesis methyltransferase
VQIPTGFVDKARFVRTIFTDVEKEYDFLLHLMTLGFDWIWRRRLLARIQPLKNGRVLDLACGTGLLTFDLVRSLEAGALVVGLDPSQSMMKTAIRKKSMLRSGCMLDLVRATGEYLPFRSQTFQYVTVGLALRNFGNKSAVFSECCRILVSHGWFLSVDFVLPDGRLLRRLYLFHIFHVLPALGRLVSANWHRTLAYLARSIELSNSATEIQRMLSEGGFQRTFQERITLGIVALIGGETSGQL